MKNILIAALAFGAIAAAQPAGAASLGHTSPAVVAGHHDDMMVQVRHGGWGHRHHNRGHHYGWGRGRGHHYGWGRGRGHGHGHGHH